MKPFDLSMKIFVFMLLLGFSAVSDVFAKKAGAEDIDGLVKALHGNDREAQIRAVESLERIDKPWAVDALLSFVLIEMEDWRVKIRAIRVLGEIPDPRVSDKLVTLFNDPFLNEECPAMKWYTALALGKDFNRGSRAVESLINAMDDDNVLVREGVIKALGKIGDTRAVPFLIPALKSKSFAIRISAVKALEHIGDPVAIPHLRKAADDDGDGQIREAALTALRNLGVD